MSKLQSNLKNLPPQLVLKPCDVEFSRIFKNVEEGVRVNVSVSEIEVHIAATTVHTVMGKFPLVNKSLGRKLRIRDRANRRTGGQRTLNYQCIFYAIRIEIRY